jgi:hypothetical protein
MDMLISLLTKCIYKGIYFTSYMLNLNIYFIVMPRIKPRALYMSGKHSTTESYPPLQYIQFLFANYFKKGGMDRKMFWFQYFQNRWNCNKGKVFVIAIIYQFSITNILD